MGSGIHNFDDLEKIDLRAGTIARVEEIHGTDKRVWLIVDFGDHTRKILAGMRQARSDPSEIQGRQTLFVLNLEPRIMMGEISEGMRLARDNILRIFPNRSNRSRNRLRWLVDNG